MNKIGIITTIIAIWTKHLNNPLHQIVPVISIRDRLATGNGLDSAGNSNTGGGLGKYGSARIAGFSPSMKLILNILENLGPLTQKEITRVTRLPTRTVRYALSRLKEEILEEREYFQDARQCLYQIKY